MLLRSLRASHDRGSLLTLGRNKKPNMFDSTKWEPSILYPIEREVKAMKTAKEIRDYRDQYSVDNLQHLYAQYRLDQLAKDEYLIQLPKNYFISKVTVAFAVLAALAAVASAIYAGIQASEARRSVLDTQNIQHIQPPPPTSPMPQSVSTSAPDAIAPATAPSQTKP
jgi:hypothetical protein